MDSPRSVSTEFKGFERLPGSGKGNGVAIGGVSVCGEVPSESAAITS